MSVNSDLESRVGYAFRDAELLDMALTHASVQKRGGDNERLEFLGDRVAGLVIAEMLYRAFPEENEGSLARRHAALVQKAAFVRMAQETGLGLFLRLSSGEAKAGGVEKDTILGDAAEALVGAIYLDGGFDAAAAFVTRFWQAMLQTQEVPPQDPKTALQEWAQARGLGLPSYDVLSCSGADHAPEFEIEARVGDRTASARARSKRAAEKTAAAALLAQLEEDT